MIEASLGLPQLYSNWKTKSIKGLSLTMIGLWFLGDFFKTIYYLMEVMHSSFRINLSSSFSAAQSNSQSILSS
jgi:uncharacterized protein with PQ loop repeat